MKKSDKYQDIDNDREPLVWKAQEGPQCAFLACSCFEVFYGGACGGAKTESLLIDVIRNAEEWKHVWKAVLFRRSYPQLEEIIQRSQEIYPELFPDAVYSDQKKMWTLPGGAIIKFRSLDTAKDLLGYHGQSYNVIAFDELPHWATSYEYEFMKSRCRSSTAGIPKRIRATGNPGFPGASWVKKYFIDNGPYNIVKNEQGLSRVFIPSKLSDNKILEQNDPGYRRRLEAIKDPILRRALLEGDWSVNVGSFFGDVFDTNIHVIRPFIPPSNWFSNRSLDWGSSKPYSIIYYTESNGEVLPDGRCYPKGALIIFYEIYGVYVKPNGTIDADVGLRESSEDIAKKMLTMEMYWYSKTKTIIYPGPADLDIFSREDNHCIYDGFKKYGIKWDKANKGPNSRITGWQLMRELIMGNDKPMFYVASNCIQWLRTVPSLVRSVKNWEDIEDGQEDHGADSTRYRLLSRKPFIPSGQKYWK